MNNKNKINNQIFTIEFMIINNIEHAVVDYYYYHHDLIVLDILEHYTRTSTHNKIIMTSTNNITDQYDTDDQQYDANNE
ncbi:hypothetical protein DERF_006229 [Dermatophagoides farinae]|uniref:Uncharacterized protein n=1 Tax=Dermatophagoides farinae TaxID=6954 RepID=A0A922IB73_DERFA|nr:hypothetical protein DERF_006229 [Dermatophagoides farinae]